MRGMRDLLKTAGNALDKTETRRGRSNVGGREANVLLNKIVKPVTTVRESLFPVNTRDDNLVNLRACAR